MALYRIKQFFKGIMSRITREDIEYINKYLNHEEISLFNRLSKSEKKHCINVARAVEKRCRNKNIDKEFMIKLGLLHDIGKIYIRLTLIDKSILVLLDAITKGKIRKYTKIKKIDMYYNHGEWGYKLLKERDYNNKFLYLVRNHHKIPEKYNLEFNILKKSDDEN